MSSLTIRLDELTIDTTLQPRAKGLDPDHAEGMADFLRENPKRDLPPGRVFRLPDGSHLLTQGFHRAEGYARAGRTHMPVELAEGDRTAAVIDAMSGNQENTSLYRSSADKRRAVAEVLRVAPEWSDRRIADRLGVGDGLVRQMRTQVQEKGTSTDVRTRVGKDGKEYKVRPQAKTKPAAERSAAEEDAVRVGCVPPADGERERVAQPLDEPASDHPADLLAGSINRLCRSLDAAKNDVKALAADPFGRHIHAESVTLQIESARKALWQARPTEPCNCVSTGSDPNPACKACFGTGRTTASRVLKGGR